MLDHLFWIAIGIFLIAAIWFIKLAAKKGWSWAAAKLESWWNKGKADIASLGSRVTSLENDVAALKGKATAPVVKPPAAVPVAAPAPQPAVQQSPNSNG